MNKKQVQASLFNTIDSSIKHQINTSYIAGIDEAGRGSWAGPMAVGIVVRVKKPLLLNEFSDYDVNDSKLLKAKQREILYNEIKGSVLWSHVEWVNPGEIAEYNLNRATMRAILRLMAIMPDKYRKDITILLDGNYRFDIPYPIYSIIKGDQKILSIAEASILAKVRRDRLMQRLHGFFPKYNFFANKGYGTAEHQKALQTFGVCPWHRKNYKPIAQIIENGF